MAFPPTNWTRLAQATLHGDGDGQRALDEMCAAYRQPVAAFLASRGYDRQEIDDLTQEFFLRWLRQRAWKRAERARGKFRTYLLATLVHMLAHHHARENAAKRGGGQQLASLEDLSADGIEPADERLPDSPVFDRAWATALVANTLSAVESEFSQRGRGTAFSVLRHFLPQGGTPITLEEAARLMDSNVGAVKISVHRLRERFRELLRVAVASTVSAPHEVDDELRYLHTLMSNPASENRNTL